MISPDAPAPAGSFPRRRPGHGRARRAAGALLAALLVGIVGAGCQDGAAPEAETTVDREVFVQAYVDLREAALLHGDELSDSLRSAVLDRHGVTPEELLRFAEVRGDDVDYMNEVWSEIESRLEARRVPLDSLSGGGP